MSKSKELIELEANHKAIKLANEHWAWLQMLLERVYKDAFIHGYRHGRKHCETIKD